MTDNINTALLVSSGVEVDFTFSPSVAFTYTAPDGVTQTSQGAVISQITLFTASAQIYDTTGELSIISYHWDFGDGMIGSGATATHTYVMPNFQAFAVLRVTDSLGRVWSARHQLYLTSSSVPGEWQNENISWQSDITTWASKA